MPSRVNNAGLCLRSFVKIQRLGAIPREGGLPPGKQGLGNTRGILEKEPGLRVVFKTTAKTNRITVLCLPGRVTGSGRDQGERILTRPRLLPGFQGQSPDPPVLLQEQNPRLGQLQRLSGAPRGALGRQMCTGTALLPPRCAPAVDAAPSPARASGAPWLPDVSQPEQLCPSPAVPLAVPSPPLCPVPQPCPSRPAVPVPSSCAQLRRLRFRAALWRPRSLPAPPSPAGFSRLRHFIHLFLH